MAIRFDDGAAYERMVGTWSRLAGETFLAWLEPQPGLQWIDVGCGTGAFTDLIVERCSPQRLEAIDPSEGQLAFARTKPAARIAQFQTGSAVDLPFADRSFDAAVMALVIPFVPDPAKSVGEMRRVVRPGGSVSAYTWDGGPGGSPVEPIRAEMRGLGILAPSPSGQEGSTEALKRLWTEIGLDAVETRVIEVERTFTDFDDLWSTSAQAPALGQSLATVSPTILEELRRRVRLRLAGNDAGPIAYRALANAVKGRVPGVPKQIRADSAGVERPGL